MSVTATLAQNFAVQASANLRGVGVRFRVMDETLAGTLKLEPGTVTFPLQIDDTRPFSFTWVGTNPAERQHTFHLQWEKRLPSSGSVSMDVGATTAMYQGAPMPSC
jgi:hypothetical protein